MPVQNLTNDLYSGPCDNCGNPSSKLTRHELPAQENNMKAGAVVYDCPKCMVEYTAMDPRVAIAREIQKVWLERTYKGKTTPITKGYQGDYGPGGYPETFVAPDIRCSMCHVKAPVKYTKLAAKPAPYDPGNILGMDRREGYLGDITGWMLIEFPVVDRRHPPVHAEGTLPNVPGFREHHKICPDCAKHIQGTINHHKDGYHDPEE